MGLLGVFRLKFPDLFEVISAEDDSLFFVNCDHFGKSGSGAIDGDKWVDGVDSVDNTWVIPLDLVSSECGDQSNGFWPAVFGYIGWWEANVADILVIFEFSSIVICPRPSKDKQFSDAFSTISKYACCFA